jgi:hypothetical protein
LRLNSTLALGVAFAVAAPLKGQSPAVNPTPDAAISFVLVRPRGHGTPVVSLDSYDETILIHLEFDNPCGYQPRGTAQASGDTVQITIEGVSWSQLCPARYRPQGFAAAVRSIVGRRFVRIVWLDSGRVSRSDTAWVDVR